MTLQKDRLFLVLTALLGLTLVSWLASSSLGLGRQTLGVSVLVLAFVKVRLIIVYYMEASTVCRPIRVGLEGWVFGVAGATIALYLL
ncbi:MAG: cytochrome C oxidase subunit IV family protein [Acidimicrobiales bacterium]|nr:cytochrome C oxidase subunit IV family protein [Acidimicrobiales bacterium]